MVGATRIFFRRSGENVRDISLLKSQENQSIGDSELRAYFFSNRRFYLLVEKCVPFIDNIKDPAFACSACTFIDLQYIFLKPAAECEWST